jgi:Flp pilus assembly protein protease CpaA
MADYMLALRLGSVVVIAIVYMLYDLFNRRNVPSIVVYATLAYGIILTLLYLDVIDIVVSLLIAVAVLAIGYLIYRIGQLGFADVAELAALSMMLPMQNVPMLINVLQYNLPFIASVVINSGIAVLIIVPLYYIPLAARKFGSKRLDSMLPQSNWVKVGMVTVVYALFLAFLVYFTGTGWPGIALITVMMAGSALLLFFEKPITNVMVRYVGLKGMEEGDIIATNLMSRRELASVKRRVPGFERLVTAKLMATMRRKRFSSRLPVYKNAMPFAVAIFVGAVLALLFGNLLLYIIPL